MCSVLFLETKYCYLSNATVPYSFSAGVGKVSLCSSWPSAFTQNMLKKEKSGCSVWEGKWVNNEDRLFSEVIYLLRLSLTNIVIVISKVAIYKSLIFHIYEILLIHLPNLHSMTKLLQCLCGKTIGSHWRRRTGRLRRNEENSASQVACKTNSYACFKNSKWFAFCIKRRRQGCLSRHVMFEIWDNTVMENSFL